MNETLRSELGRILVTGATGKVGRTLVSSLLAQDAAVTVLTRAPTTAQGLWPGQPIEVRQGDLTRPDSLGGICNGIDTLIHLASYAPQPGEPDIYNAPSHWPVTAEGTKNLMAQIAGSGVKRLVYLSTIKAMGDQAGSQGHPANESCAPAPDTLYGRAKLAAELDVLAAGAKADIAACVLRLPMVYGMDGEGNLARMITAIEAGRFPPWPRIDNHRSAIHVEDAVAAAILAAQHPASAGQTYVVTDGRGYSTRWIYERILVALGRPAPRWTVPLWALRLVAAGGSLGEQLLSRRMPLTLDGLDKLVGDAWYSSERLTKTLGFTPRHSLETEIPCLVRRMRG
jgi:UDP-glucose 4-epimerase